MLSLVCRGSAALLARPARPGQQQVRMVRYLAQQEAIDVDQELFNSYQFGVAQLMELAGLSCAQAVARVYPSGRAALVVAGPGNNGGDGLVLARHLVLLGFSATLFYPRRTSNPLYSALLHQAEQSGVTVRPDLPSLQDAGKQYGLVVDCLFGFSYKPPLRDWAVPVLEMMAKFGQDIPLVSVDIPSGWDVEDGPPAAGPVLAPALLVSLTAPKLCAKHHRGKHWLGGRFVPPDLAEKYKLDLPAYPGTDLAVLLSDDDAQHSDL